MFETLLVSKQRVSPFYRDLHLLLKLGSGFYERNVDETLFVSKQRVSPFYRDLHLLHERNVFRFPEYGALILSKQRVSPFYHDLDLGLVKLIGNFLLVDQLLLRLSSIF